MKKMEVGEIIKPKMNDKGSHWLAEQPVEKAMELYRKKNFPDKPSRLNGIYCSVIPRSRFKDKGYLYAVKPIGKMLMTNSRYIDAIGDNWQREMMQFSDRYRDWKEALDNLKNEDTLLYLLDGYLAHKYWEGDGKGDMEGIEVLCESAQVTEVINEEGFHVGDNIMITEDDKVRVETTIYIEENKPKPTKNFIEKIKKLYSNPDIKETYYDHNSGGNIRITGFLKKGVKLKLVYLQDSMRKRKGNYDEYDIRENYKYIRIRFMPYFSDEEKLNMDYFYSYTNKIHDVSKYFKKIS
jgi:hypothetical protein